MVKKGFSVYTRADANTIEARKDDYSGWEAAKKSGAQIIKQITLCLHRLFFHLIMWDSRA